MDSTKKVNFFFREFRFNFRLIANIHALIIEEQNQFLCAMVSSKSYTFC